jgi:spore coat protein A
MRSHRFDTTRRARGRAKLRVEHLEDRHLLAATIPGVTLDPMLVPKFVNALPPALALGNDGFEFQPTGTTTGGLPLYTVGAYQIQQNLGLGLTDANGNPVTTTVYGYGISAAAATYPGRTFEVQEDVPIAVQWVNGLTGGTHILPVDPTVLGANVDSNNNPYYTVTVDPATGAQSVTFNSGIPMVTHVHGGHTSADFDGTPMQWMTATGPNQQVGPDFVSNPFIYNNNQQAANIWYHDHAMGITRLNVYAGLAGFYIVHDTNEAGLIADHTLPDERYDFPLAIQDRMFTAPGGTGPTDPGGQLYYPADVLPGTTAAYPSVHPEFFGDTILVDGQAWPALNVEPRWYRFRIVNGSQSRFYNLQLNAGGTKQSQTFYQIGTDTGLLSAPVPLTQLLIAPGERADILIDFSTFANQTVIMTNNAKGPYPKGAPVDPATTGQIMAFQVSGSNSAIPDATPFARPLNTIPAPVTQGVPVRPLGLFETLDQYGRLTQKLGSLPLNSNLSTTPIAPSDFEGPGANPTTVQLIRNADGSQSVTEQWQVYNTTADTHPIHLHSTSFQIVSRQKFNWKVVDPATGAFIVTALTGRASPPAANEMGWKDTVQMNPGEVTTILVTFDVPGNFVWHCHILEHEEHDMMNQLVVLAAPTAAAAPAAVTTASATITSKSAMMTTAPTATSSTRAGAISRPVSLTSGSTLDQVATSTVVDPGIDLTSVPLDPIHRKKLLGY